MRHAHDDEAGCIGPMRAPSVHSDTVIISYIRIAELHSNMAVLSCLNSYVREPGLVRKAWTVSRDGKQLK